MTENTKQVWQEKLTPEQFNVCWNKGTEAAFTGQYTDCKTAGIYHCVCCNSPLFDSQTKYNSGTGWPSFWDVLSAENVVEVVDNSYGMQRVEVVCKHCHAHLGHVFKDGPKPTGLRYCINSLSLELKEKN